MRSRNLLSPWKLSGQPIGLPQRQSRPLRLSHSLTISFVLCNLFLTGSAAYTNPRIGLIEGGTFRYPGCGIGRRSNPLRTQGGFGPNSGAVVSRRFGAFFLSRCVLGKVVRIRTVIGEDEAVSGVSSSSTRGRKQADIRDMDSQVLKAKTR